MILDEPTNHLDIPSILWLENLLSERSRTWVAISHDRYFLEKVATSVFEINRIYPGSCFSSEGNYSRFLENREAFLAAEHSRAQSLDNKVRREIEWLRRGPKARSTKQKARIDKAYELTSELANVKSRLRTSSVEI
ncbi:MAG: ABC-F family ATP-binding cassette domain-containing protein, partial [Bdellovibrionales bacterium]|nr:ABC-F family ATP-binding cassette domain-containing protein [Bdellovibrionales bacterium]